MHTHTKCAWYVHTLYGERKRERQKGRGGREEGREREGEKEEGKAENDYNWLI